MTYQELKNATKNQPLPAAYKNSDGENVIINHKTDVISFGETRWERNYYKLTTAQHNGWTRHNFIFEDGSTEEFYEA